MGLSETHGTPGDLWASSHQCGRDVLPSHHLVQAQLLSVGLPPHGPQQAVNVPDHSLRWLAARHRGGHRHIQQPAGGLGDRLDLWGTTGASGGEGADGFCLATGDGGCTAEPGMPPNPWPIKRCPKRRLSPWPCLSRRDGTSCGAALHACTCVCFQTSTPAFSSSWVQFELIMESKVLRTWAGTRQCHQTRVLQGKAPPGSPLHWHFPAPVPHPGPERFGALLVNDKVLLCSFFLFCFSFFKL